VFAAVQPHLIKYSAHAWMTMLFIVVFTGAVYLLYVGYERDQPRMQLAGAAGTVVAMLAHELGVLLAFAVFLTLGIRTALGDLGWFSGPKRIATAGILGFNLLLFIALGLFLRAGTVAGATGEFQHYIGPSLSLDRLLIDYDRFWVVIPKTSDRYGLVLLPLLGLLATWAIAEVARLVSGWFRIGNRAAHGLRSAFFV
jgi:hypothetical protein